MRNHRRPLYRTSPSWNNPPNYLSASTPDATVSDIATEDGWVGVESALRDESGQGWNCFTWDSGGPSSPRRVPGWGSTSSPVDDNEFAARPTPARLQETADS
jgi:hypothetical protein